MKTKKILSFLLALVMVLSILPAAAYAEEYSCGQEPHKHASDCFVLDCAKVEHQHGESCDAECAIEVHTHNDECMKLVCEKAEHTHGDECVKKAAELKTNIGDVKFVVGEPQEFTFSTVANDDAGVMVLGTSDFSDASALAKLEYYEVKDGKWYDLNGDFGAASGFPMADATSKFRATFSKAGTYSFTASMKKAEGGDVLCSLDVEFTVSEPAPAEYKVTSEVVGKGTVTVAETVKAGEDLAIKVEAAEGYELKSLMVNDADVTAKVVDGAYTVEKVAADVAVKATFVEKVVAPADVAIEDITVEFAAPVVGEDWDFTVKATSTPADALDMDALELIWLTDDAETEVDPAVQVAAGEHFYRIVLKAAKGYTLSENVKCTVKMGGVENKHSFQAMTGDYLYLSNNVQVAAKEEPKEDVKVTAVKFTVAAPVVGETLPTKATVVTTPANGMRFGGVVWSVVGEDGMFEAIDDKDAKAEAGKTYIAKVDALMNDGFVWAVEDNQVVINGDELEALIIDGVYSALCAFDVDADVDTPTIIEGANGTWTNTDKDGLTVRSDADFKDFVSVSVDGKTIDAKNYTVKEGSTIVTLTPEYLKTLAVGKHTLGIMSNNGKAETEFTINHEHVLTKVDAKKETCTEKGNKEYYTCECEKWFEDKDAKTEIVDKTSVEIKAAGHTAATTWSCDSKSHWHKCTVCGKEADEKKAHDFDKETGKICQTCKYDVDNPKTGDESHIGVIAVIMAIAGIGLVATTGYYFWDKKRKA